MSPLSFNTNASQHLDAVAKAIVTRGACAELTAPGSGVVRQWFVWQPDESVNRASLTCSPAGAPHTPRGALTEMFTRIDGAWSEAGALRPDAGVGSPCASPQRQRVRLHDYCVPLARFGHALMGVAMWRRGVSLLGNELHTDNFHHFNRDLLFFARMLRILPEASITNIVLTDHAEIAEWAIHHARAVLGNELLERLILLPRRRAPSVRRASLAQSLPPWRSVQPQPRYVCFETALEKLVTDPVDRADLRWLRTRAHAYCGVTNAADSGTAPRLLLLLLRGDPALGDKPSTARQMANGGEVRAALEVVARAHGLVLMPTAFAGMSYCEQVALASRARAMVGVHGQGLSNGIFMADDGLVVENFHGGARPHWRAFDNVGHQPLYVGAGRPYVAAPLAESDCGVMAWKHDVRCTSLINASRLAELVTWALVSVTGERGVGCT